MVGEGRRGARRPGRRRAGSEDRWQGLYWSRGYGEAAETKELRNIQAAETGKGQWLLG